MTILAFFGLFICIIIVNFAIYFFYNWITDDNDGPPLIMLLDSIVIAILLFILIF